MTLVSEGLAQPRRALAVAAVLAGMALVVLDASAVNVALPTISRSLKVEPTAAIFVVTAYQAALVMALWPCGALGERFGYRRVFTFGIALFTAASALCALAPTFAVLVAARFVQGLGGAAVMALGVALLRFATPAHRFGAAIGWNALTVALCSAAGPSVGAAAISLSGWPLLFAANLPLGVAALLATRALPPSRPGRRRLDLVSMALNGLMFGALVLGVEALPRDPIRAFGLALTGGLALFTLLHREVSKPLPLVPFDLLRSRTFRLSVMASICCFAGQTAGLVAIPFYLQNSLGRSALEAGACMSAWPLAAAVAATLVGRLSATAWPCVLGGGLLAASLGALSAWPLSDDLRPFLAMSALGGIGFGLFQTPNNRNMFLSAPPDRSGAAGGMQGVARLTGQTAGAGLVAVLFAVLPADLAPRFAFGIGAVLTLAAGAVSALRTLPVLPHDGPGGARSSGRPRVAIGTVR